MGNIVSTWEEIELTDAELQIIYGAQDCDDDLRGIVVWVLRNRNFCSYWKFYP